VKDAGEQTEYVADVVGGHGPDDVAHRGTVGGELPQLLPTCGAVTDGGPEDRRVRGHPTK
jgi:hypothetical protein